MSGKKDDQENECEVIIHARDKVVGLIPEETKTMKKNGHEGDTSHATIDAKMAGLSCVGPYTYITLCFNCILLYISTFCIIIGNEIQSFWDKYSQQDETCYIKYGFEADRFINVALVVIVLTLVMIIIAIYRIRTLNIIKSEMLSNKKSESDEYKLRKRCLKITNVGVTVWYYTSFVGCVGLSLLLISSLNNATTVLDSMLTSNTDCVNVNDNDVESITGAMDTMWVMSMSIYVFAVLVTLTKVL